MGAQPPPFAYCKVGGKGEERRDFILNYIETRQLEEGRRENVEWEEGRREKGMYSKFHPPSNLFCFLYFILRKIKGEERREFILNSTPLESSFVFCFLYWKNQRSRDETVFVSRSRFYFKSQTREWEEGRRDRMWSTTTTTAYD